MPFTSYMVFNVLEKIWLDLTIVPSDVEYLNELNLFFL